MGMAYQIIDDVLDFLSTPEYLGKPSGSDLLEGNITLPVIYGLQDDHCGKEIAALLAQPAYLEAQLDRIKELLQQCGAFAKSMQLAESYLADARASLRIIPEPGRQALSSLSYALSSHYFNKMAPSYSQES